MAKRAKAATIGGAELEAAKAKRRDPEEGRNLEALQRWAGRRQPVRVKIERGADGGLVHDATANETVTFAVRMADAVGSGSTDFALRQLDRLSGMVGRGDTKPGRSLNSLLAAVESVRPENEIEGMLAVQMAATHEAAMGCLAQVSRADSVPILEACGALATKLLRTYTMQIEALSKLRRDGEQKVKVEHVHVYEGGQAIVGHVEHGGRGGRESGQQPHTPLDPRFPCLCACRAAAARRRGAGWRAGRRP